MMIRSNIVVVMCLLVLSSQSTLVHAKPKKQTKKQTIKQLSLEGYKLFRAKKWKECVVTFKKLSTIHPAASVYSNLAICFEKQGKYTLAKKYYELALSTSTKAYNPETTKGASSIKATQKAIKAVEKKIELQDRLNVTVDAAKKHQIDGKHNLAIKNYLEAYNYENNAIYLLEAARSALKIDKLPEALRWVDRSLLESEIPLDEANRKRATALKAKIETQIQAKRQAKKDMATREAQRRYQFSWVGYTGLVIGSLGLAGLGYTAYEGQQLDSDIDALEQERDPKRYANAKTDILNRQSQAKTIIWVGSSLVAVGVGLFAWDFFTRGVEPWSVSVSPTTDGANVQMMWRF